MKTHTVLSRNERILLLKGSEGNVNSERTITALELSWTHYCRSPWQDPSQLFHHKLVSFFSSPRKRYRKVLYCVVVIQKNYRAFSGRKKFLCLKKAATVLQKQWRGQLARRLYREQLEEKRRQEEERRKEEEERCSLWLTSLSCLCPIRCWSESLYFRIFLNKWFWKPLLLLLKKAYSYHGSFIFMNIFVVILFLAVFSRWQMISVS